MTSVSKNVYIDKLANIFNYYNSTYHKTVKIKLIDVNSSTSFVIDIENNDKDPKFEVGDHVRISKCKNIFLKCYTPK